MTRRRIQFHIVTQPNCVSEDKAIKVRLVGTNVSHVGQVAIQYKGTWGAVCNDGWDINDAHVICRMLGYKGAESPIWWIEREESLPFLLDNVGCTGKETSIAECAHNGWSKHNCGRREHAGVVCQVDKGEEFILEIEIILDSQLN